MECPDGTSGFGSNVSSIMVCYRDRVKTPEGCMRKPGFVGGRLSTRCPSRTAPALILTTSSLNS
ncbi:hypothetical protein MLPF_3201 [Mycobacterium lepromatosis]|nr:hypothetical protein MLPF_3201 [Mycobacterium lepromatosis]